MVFLNQFINFLYENICDKNKNTLVVITIGKKLIKLIINIYSLTLSNFKTMQTVIEILFIN